MNTTTSTTSTMNPEQQQSQTNKKKSDFNVVADISEWKTQLITKEDPTYIHKVLGILCLCSFIWRVLHIGDSDMAFISHPQYTIPTILLHLSLTLSSFIFKIPIRRIKDGTRIWPEYRLHALVFLCRSLACIFVYWYEQIYNLPRYYDINFIIVIGTFIAADLCSASVGKEYQSNSIRDLDTHPMAKYFFSIMQFNATAGYLQGLRRYSFLFLVVMVVQLTPFLGTLRRKNLIGRDFGSFMYGVFLVGGYTISRHYSPGGTDSLLRITACFGFIAATWRLIPLPKYIPSIVQNKYVIWITIGSAIRYLRPYYPQWPDSTILFVFRCELVMILLLGYYKVNYGYNNSIGKNKANHETVVTSTVKKDL